MIKVKFSDFNQPDPNNESLFPTVLPAIFFRIFAAWVCAADMLFVDPDDPLNKIAQPPEGYRGETHGILRGGNFREFAISAQREKSEEIGKIAQNRPK